MLTHKSVTAAAPRALFLPAISTWEIHGALWQLTGEILSSPCREGVNECVRGADIVCRRNMFCLANAFLKKYFSATFSLHGGFFVHLSQCCDETTGGKNQHIPSMDRGKASACLSSFISSCYSPLSFHYRHLILCTLPQESFRFILCNSAQKFWM